MLHENINMRALKVASMFTSKDDVRPILMAVQMLSPWLFVGTDSYRMCIVSGKVDTPADVVFEAIKAGRELYHDYDKNIHDDDEQPLIPRSIIETAAKLGGATLKGAWDMLAQGGVARFDHWDTPYGTLRGADHRTVAGGLQEGKFPPYYGLLSSEMPPACHNAAFNAEYIAHICAAAKMWGGGNGRNDPPMPIVFHGGEMEEDGSVKKPCYWSCQSDHGTMVVIQMPVRGDKRISKYFWGEVSVNNQHELTVA